MFRFNVMTFRFNLLFLCITTFSQAFAGLDLTPTTREYTEDGDPYRVVHFKNGDGIVKFFPPDGWTVRGQLTRLQLTPPQKSLSEGVVEVTPLAAPQPLDENVVAVLRQSVLAALPPGSGNPKIVSEASNTLMPGGNPSVEIVISYQLWGKSFQRSVLLVNSPHEHLFFRFTATKDDFNLLHNAFRRSVASWQWVDKPAPVVAQRPPTAAK
jgi:hypothetical protein